MPARQLGELEAARYYFSNKLLDENPEIWEDKPIDGGHIIYGEGRWASAPCITSQHVALIVRDDQPTISLHIVMDEEREDIVIPIFESFKLLQ